MKIISYSLSRKGHFRIIAKPPSLTVIRYSYSTNPTYHLQKKVFGFFWLTIETDYTTIKPSWFDDTQMKRNAVEGYSNA